MFATHTPAEADAVSFFDNLQSPTIAALFDVRIICDMLMHGSHGDADPRTLLEGAIAKLQEVRAGLES